MSTLAEIEAAAATLMPQEMAQLEAFLHERRQRAEQELELSEIVRQNGVHPLPRRNGALITTEMTRQLCEEEGI